MTFPDLPSHPAQPPIGKPNMLHAALRTLGPPILAGLALALLYAWGRSGLEEHRRFLMPTLDALWAGGFGDARVRQELARAAWTTAQIALAGLALTIPLGVLLGLLMFRVRFMERALSPYLVALQAIPILAIIPLLQALLGFDFFPKVVIVAIFTFFAIPTTLLFGLKSVEPGLLDLFRLQGASWETTLWKGALPAALPTLFAGLRISAGLAVIGAVVSELFFVSGDGGLGQMLINSKIDFLYEQMYAALIVSIAMSIAVYLFFGWLGARIFAAWHPSETGRR